MPGPGVELIGEEETAEVLEVLSSGFLSRYGPADDPAFGAKVHRVEEQIAALAGVRHGLGLSGGGSAALLVSLLGLGVGAGDEVIVPGFTFVASISAIVYAGATPVLAEIDDSFDLDPSDVEAKISPRTAAIIVVHMLGGPARMTELAIVKHSVVLLALMVANKISSSQTPCLYSLHAAPDTLAGAQGGTHRGRHPRRDHFLRFCVCAGWRTAWQEGDPLRRDGRSTWRFGGHRGLAGRRKGRLGNRHIVSSARH